MLPQVSADFIATGEVLGERPMSQNKQALELIEKKSSTKGILLRPLSAKLLPETEVEKRGLVDRSKLLAIKGRKRTEQLRLAKEYGIKEIPTPAGGCLLTDPVIGQRTLEILKRGFPLTPDTVKLLVLGRHYIEENFWLVLGRNEEENKKIEAIANGKFPLFTLSEPAPLLALIQGELEEAKLFEVLVSRSKKARLALSEGKKVSLIRVEEKWLLPCLPILEPRTITLAL
jgi:Predicted tRNA(5-methylaminomethyl-2-thiouridylate) methyltransferase, contains the PP-loop ATPase domain